MADAQVRERIDQGVGHRGHRADAPHVQRCAEPLHLVKRDHPWHPTYRRSPKRPASRRFDITIWMGFFLPARDAGPIAARLNTEIDKIAARRPTLQKKLAEQAPRPCRALIQHSSPHSLKAESEKYRNIIKDASVDRRNSGSSRTSDEGSTARTQRTHSYTDLVSRGDLPIERCTQLRRALLGGIIDVEEPETGAEAVGPLEIVHQAPMEIAAHRHALGRRALQLRQVAAQEHDAVGVVDETVRGRHVGRRAAVLGDVDVAHVPDLGHVARPPVERLGADLEPGRIHRRILGRERHGDEAGRGIATRLHSYPADRR